MGQGEGEFSFPCTFFLARTVTPRELALTNMAKPYYFCILFQRELSLDYNDLDTNPMAVGLAA